MDVYYRKSMGNGTIASKFRFNTNILPTIHSSESDVRHQPKEKDLSRNKKLESLPPTNDANTIEKPVSTDAVSSNDSLVEMAHHVDVETVSNEQNEASLNQETHQQNGHKSKFKLASITEMKNNDTASVPPISTTTDSAPSSSPSPSSVSHNKFPIEFPETHHPSNCVRCYRLKKKCTRSYPKCSNCSRTGAQCEYVDRSVRRYVKRKLDDSHDVTHNNDKKSRSNKPQLIEEAISTDGGSSESLNKHSITTSEPSTDKSQVFQLVNDGGADKKSQNFPNNSNEPIDTDTHVVAHKLVSISSLLSNDEGHRKLIAAPSPSHSEKDREHPNHHHNHTHRPGHRLISHDVITKSKPQTKTSSETLEDLARIISLKAFSYNSEPSTNLREEFITMQTFSNTDLPHAFVTGYFQNYEFYYPFINKTQFLTSFNKVDFSTETIINLDVYLLMSIGCLIYDSNNRTKFFEQYFSFKVIESIANVIHFKNSAKTEDNDDTLESVRLLLLLAIFSLNLCNESLCWATLGLLDRLVIQLNYHRAEPGKWSTARERVFWSAFNLDKEYSLLTDRPSLLPIDDYISLTLPLSEKLNIEDESDTFIQLISQSIQLHRFQDQMNYLKLSTVPRTHEQTSNLLKEFSSNLEKWRVASSSLIHTHYAGLPNLQEFIAVINLNYYFLLIEMDQVSSSESFQFTLQFLSNSFGLLLSENGQGDAPAKTAAAPADKHIMKISMNSLFWYKKFFKVIKYNLGSLIDIIESATGKSETGASGMEISMKLSEFNGNLQLIINLLRYIDQSDFKPSGYASRIELSINKLSGLSMELMKYGIGSINRTSLVEDIRSFQARLDAGTQT